MTAWLTALGEELDTFLNVLLLWFVPPATKRNQTISEHAAEAQTQKRLWGCVLCQWLSWTVERNHCGKTLRGAAMTRIAALKAGAQLVLVAVLLDLLARLFARSF